MSKTFGICIVSILIFFNFKSYAQQELLDKYDQETIYLQNNGFIKNGQLTKYGFFYKNLKKELVKSPTTIVELDNFKRKQKTALGLYAAGAGIVLFGASQVNENETTSLIALAAGLGLCVASLINYVDGTNSMHKAVWQHNRKILSGN